VRIVVTGCAGLIGSKVSELLPKEGHSVIGVGNPTMPMMCVLRTGGYPDFEGSRNFLSIGWILRLAAHFLSSSKNIPWTKWST